jgi:hypothetical protein
MNKTILTIIGLGIAGAIGWKIWSDKKESNVLPSGSTPEEKASNIRSQMALYAPGGPSPDTAKYLSLQEELELVELETGL